LVATDITVDSDNDSVNISLDKMSIVDGTLSGTTININSATASKAGILVPTDKSKIDKIITNGNGTKYLSDNGTYKEVQGGIDSSNYGKVINVPNGSYLTLDKNATGTEAIEFINNIFGSTDRLKEVVMDIIEHH
jgi:hypothetical protein